MRAAKRLTLGAALVLAACAAPNLSSPHNTQQPEAMDSGDVTLMPASYAQTDGKPPIALTTPDGNALELVSVEANAVVEGPLAFTELHLVFDNPDHRTIEGRFEIALPQHASVSRFAMKIGDQWQEGEVVEKMRARQIYEDFLHRRVDPALLEQGAGNAFSARVFPIAAGEKKHLILSYSQEITEDSETLVPLRGLGELAELSVTLSGGGKAPARLKKTAFEPDGDFIVGRKHTGSHAVRSGNLAVARIQAVSDAPAEPLAATLVLIDTSASRAYELGEQLALSQQIAKRIAQNGDHQLVVAGFDQQIAEVYAGPAAQYASSHVARLKARRAMGASDVTAALRWARQRAQEASLTRVILISDGVVTAGEDGKDLLAAAKALGRSGVVRLDAVAFGGLRDEAELRALVTAGLGHDGTVLDGRRAAGSLARLERATRSNLKVAVEGARWYWPRRIDGAQPGDEVLVYAQLAENKELKVRIDGRTMGVEVERVPRPLLERSWAKAKIDSLLDQERRKGKSGALRRDIIAVSTRHRVLSPYTSLLVLETQADYDRYALDREALADILSVGERGLEVLQRDLPPAPTKPNRTFAQSGPRASDDGPLDARGNLWGDQIGEAFGAGGLGVSGIAEPPSGEGINLGDVGTIGKGASGAGRLGRSHRAATPRIRMGATSVSGRLPPEVIQRIVRQNFGRMRACYQQALLRDPNLAGRISTRFLIGRDGSVATAASDGDIQDPVFRGCVANAFMRLSFPQPEGGVVSVVYPIVFTPDGAELPSTRPSQANDVNSAPPVEATVPPRATPMVARPYRGELASVMEALDEGRLDAALADAQAWQAREPASVLATVALGEALEASGKPKSAARAYGSIIDMYPSRADLRRYAGQRLDRLAHEQAARLALDTYARAKEQRPDHPTSHRLHGYSLLGQGEHEQAFDALKEGLARCVGRFAGARTILLGDLGLVAAAWLSARPKDRALIDARLAATGAHLADAPSLNFVLNWETDTNDVDLHVYDDQGNHAFYSRPRLASGGMLHGDVTTGYGPELFSIPGNRRAGGYFLQAHYYSRGPMGYGMGKVQVIEHDGKGNLKIEDRPFIVMVDRAYVDLGTIGRYDGNEAPPKG